MKKKKKNLKKAPGKICCILSILCRFLSLSQIVIITILMLEAIFVSQGYQVHSVPCVRSKVNLGLRGWFKAWFEYLCVRAGLNKPN